jgi:Tol biopolymer transport system component
VTTGYQDEDPDWSPDGTKLIFDSTRNGGQTIWTMTGGILSGSGTLSANPLWNSLANSSGPQIQYQPVFSPDGTQIAYAEATRGSSVFSADLVNMDQSYTNAENLSLSTPGNPANSEPDWQPLSTGNGTPEAPMILLLPGSALLIGGIALTIQRRRRWVPGSGVTV